MANLGIFKIVTEGEYVNLATLTSLTFTTGTKYNFQVQNCSDTLTVCLSATEPTEGGFKIKSLEKFSWTPEEGVNCWVKTNDFISATLNISD